MYFLGASGDIAAESLIPEDNVTKDYKEQGNALGIGKTPCYCCCSGSLKTQLRLRSS